MEITTIVNENNIFSISELEYIRQIIENMDKYNQIEILKIIYQKKSKCINENKYGIHINMTELTDEIINQLNEYIKYVNLKDNEINNIENKKEKYINSFFTN